MRPLSFKTCAAMSAMALFAGASAFADDAPAAPSISPAEQAKMDEEVHYISALVENGLPDFATRVIADAKKKWPVLGPKLQVLELQGELNLGHFDVVQKVLDTKKKGSPEYWALRISMGDAHYARGQMKECSAIYKDFFAAIKTPPPELKSFYIDAGYKWAQMCVNEKNFPEAVNTYSGLLKQNLDENTWCTIAMDDVELLIRLAADIKDDKKKSIRDGYLKQATEICDKLLWKDELILVFGRAIAMKAHIEMLRGNMEGAQSLVNNYMEQLSNIHNSLKEQDPDGSKGFVRMSPMPQCRFLLASVQWDAVMDEIKEKNPNDDKIKDLILGARVNGKRNGNGAYGHAINVYVNYSESPWAAQAGELVETIIPFVKDRFKADLRAATKIPAGQMKKVRAAQFRNAADIVRAGNNWEEAEKATRDVLRQFPEIEESLEAVANLVDIYLQLSRTAKSEDDKLYYRLAADAVEGYLCERFSGSTKPQMVRIAGDRTLMFASSEKDRGQLARSRKLYDSYFTCYPNHYNAAQMAFSLANTARQAEDWANAEYFYSMIANNYSNFLQHAACVQMVARCCKEQGNRAGEMDWLRRFAVTTKKPAERIMVNFNLAFMQQRSGFESFKEADTNSTPEAVEAQCKAAYADVAGAIKDFRRTFVDATNILAQAGAVAKEDVPKILQCKENALYLEGESWQRLTWPESKLPVFRKQAVKAYDTYIKEFPKGKYAAQCLAKLGSIYMAEKDMENSQKALARLQSDFPESDEAKNSVPRLAKNLIEMGLKQEGVAQYKQMMATDGKYSAAQFLNAGDALMEARSWAEAQEAFQKAIDLASKMTNGAPIIARAKIGNAKTLFKADRFAEAREQIDSFVSDDKFSKLALVVDAYEMLIDVASEEGRREKDDELRMKHFNAAVGAIKKVRAFRKTKAEQDLLDLRSGDVLVRKMDAEETMNLKDQAMETCGRAAVTFQAFLMANEPNAEHPVDKMTAAELVNLERCYATVLPLLAKLGGKDNAELILRYGATYQELFPDGKGKTVVINAINQAKAEQ